ncbi:F-box protein At4g02760 isoform X2 [Raphanus sativus]|uniref:F-box protein At4g02760 isoform X2 n=1 Tax=Raphanus sativus TaxID=3726 RepID=A0A6J0LXE7_RAPSA|nr:F-box protein At4g02760 isoform X2 [Raphanus sativus]XP_018464031.2 F-box protein At4g02760 isoform X2 [Raphanus sativus]XP_056851616.1 F-box protein At4g02760 isoform X2 [Raphanus sativus]
MLSVTLSAPMETPNPNKRLRRDLPSSSGPSSLPTVPDFNQNHVDLIISSFLSLPDFPSLSSSISIMDSFDRVIEKLLQSCSDDDRIKDRGLRLASLLRESTTRCARKHAADHNSSSWRLPHDLTVKVFSMVDKKSLMRASACCIMFKKYAMDPLCYSHTDLTTETVENRIVRNMILNAGKELRSLKVGCPDESTKSLLSGSCLAPLSSDHGFLGNLLESLHIYNHGWLDNTSLCRALSVCSNLTDLKIVGLDVNSLRKVLEVLPKKCQHLFVEKGIGSGRSMWSLGSFFLSYRPDLTSLSLIGFELDDGEVHIIIRGLPKLKYLNLSRTSVMKGGFLRHVSDRRRGSLLETIILRECRSLDETRVCKFLDSLIMSRRHLRFIRHIDVSNYNGLMHGGSKPKRLFFVFPLEKLKEKRPGVTFVADFRSPSSSSSIFSWSPYYSPSSSPGDTSSGSGSEGG